MEQADGEDGPRDGPRTTTAPRAAVVVLAGGSGTRVGAAVNKVYLPLAGRSVISWSLLWAASVPEVRHCLLVVRPEDVERAQRVIRQLRDDVPEAAAVELVIGGDTRHGSEEAALRHLTPRISSGEVEVVAIHDGARPLSGPGLFRSAIRTAAAVGGAVPTVPATGLLALAGSPDDPRGGLCAAAEPIGEGAGAEGYQLARVQTPQAFRAPALLDAFERARRAGFRGTDTASTVERHGRLVVRAVPGSPRNLKVTYPEDLALAERLLAVHAHRLP